MENFSISKLISQENPNIINLWYDWFCRDSSLKNKGEKLLQKVKQIAESKKFDKDNCYVFFKNNCPCSGPLYDDFRICDLETGDVIYTVSPKDSHYEGKATVFGAENDFDEPLVCGSWTEVKKWFNC